ncbi:MAG: copper-binding protein [Giesbergeria sp.]|uniref:copper-binding protein n=1 Tax=Giesbergeria sp. TaxID=2818473 RepID=UPI0026072861|nr:copper-binding protein [Giesbergeria sp.]MDD2610972.1 copper-binding protein [Giesbergeria sp.]
MYMQIRYFLTAGVLAMALPLAAQTNTPSHTDHDHDYCYDSSASQAPAAMTLGEVRKLDPAQGKITLRHGPIPHLNMPAMTMVFPVAEPQWLDGLKVGDKVEFTVERPHGAYKVTAIRAATNPNTGPAD